MNAWQEQNVVVLNFFKSSGKSLQCVGNPPSIAGRGAQGKWAQWTVRRADNGNLRLFNQATGKFLALRDGQTTTGTGAKWTELRPLHISGDVWVLESVQNPAWHCGVLPNGDAKPCSKTGKGPHAQFKLTVLKTGPFAAGAKFRLVCSSTGKNLRMKEDKTLNGNGGAGKFSEWEVRPAENGNLRLFAPGAGAFIALRNGENTHGPGGKWTELIPRNMGGDEWVFQSVQNPKWHIGVLPTGEIKRADKTATGGHARFRIQAL